MENNTKTLMIKTRDGTVWEVIKEKEKEYEVKARLYRVFISKHMVVAKWYKEDKEWRRNVF